MNGIYHYLNCPESYFCGRDVMRKTGLIRVSLLALISLYLVILAGSVVRMSGAGMGCPDWPKCFGQYIPPTDESQLPDNYREEFARKREAKIERFSDLLDVFGFSADAERLRNDPSLREKEEPFNAIKTWTEYINRLIGAISGLFVLLVFVLSLKRGAHPRWITFLAFFNVILLLFQAWFGSIVVATNLTPWTITVHMFVALIIVGIQIHILTSAKADQARRSRRVNKGFKVLLFFAILLSLFQILLGTQVRQEIDAISQSLPRDEWIASMGLDFRIHRSFSIAVILVNGLLFYLNFRNQWGYNLPAWLMVIIGMEALAGIVLSYAGMPALMQPVHLMLAAFMFGTQVKMLSLITSRRSDIR
jgi:cytochrome c oxidase assembly protein subunit 15